MITKMNHVSIFVLDQTSAHDFYVNKLGFKVNTDAEMGPGKRWLTVNPPDQPDLEITLMLVDDGMMFNKESAQKMRDLVKNGTFGFGSVLPGDYLIAAIADEAAGNWPDEKFLTTLAGVATPLRILGNQSTTATVRVGALK